VTRPYGDCYQASLESAEELQHIKKAVENSTSEALAFERLYEGLGLSEEIAVVHGTAIPPNGIDKGKSIVHAWVEVGDYAIECSNNQLLRIPRAHYYANHGISPIKRYTVPEARSLAMKHGLYAAWHLIDVEKPSCDIALPAHNTES
jgi:hypothetical protein